MSEEKTITVIGAGIGGFLLIAHLGALGHRMRLHDIDDSKLADLRSRGGVETEDLGTGFSELELATTDLAAAVNGAHIIIVVTGGHRQGSVAKSLAPLLRDGQAVLLIQGNTGGSLAFRRVLDQNGCTAKIHLAEMDNFPYSARKLGSTKMKPVVTKRWLQIASLPGNNIDDAFKILGPLFPTAQKAPNVLYTGFMNANALLHVVNCMANATKIDRGEQYLFYAEGVTPAVARGYMALSEERVKAAAAWGAKVPTLEEWFERVYNVREPTLPEAMQKLTYNADGPYGGTPTPKSFENNFIAEDVAVGLIPMVALAKVAGVAMPAHQTLIDFTKLMTGDDYATTARTLDHMGLAGKDLASIRKMVEQGF
jgi:opine dehydrogenase